MLCHSLVVALHSHCLLQTRNVQSDGCNHTALPMGPCASTSKSKMPSLSLQKPVPSSLRGRVTWGHSPSACS